MKRHHNIHVLVFTFAVAAASISLCLAQTKTIDKYGGAMFEGRPFFTDSALYNSYDLGGSPLGLFDKGSPRFDARFDYRYDGLGDRAGQYWNAPTLTMGNPGMSFFQIFYGPRILSDKSGVSPPLGDASLPLHRIGFVWATQGETGEWRTAISTVGFLGYQEWEDSDMERVIGGLERFRFDLGSQVHPLVRLALFIGINGRYEEVAESRIPRSCQMNLPVSGVNVDVGGEDFPARGNLDFSYSWSRFVYTIGEANNADAIRNDSLSLFLTTQARLSPTGDDDELLLKPGLLVGFTNNSGEMREPEAENNLPINLGGVRPNSRYGLMGFWFGAGAGAGVFGYVDAHVEYTLTYMSLEYESRYTGTGKSGDKSRTLHNTAFGLSTNLNKYVDMPIVITPRVAYFISGTEGTVGVSQAHLSIDPLVASRYNKESLYNPQNFLDGRFARLSGFTVGVDGQVLEGQAEASVWATFLSSSALPKGGLEFGARIGFLLK